MTKSQPKKRQSMDPKTRSWIRAKAHEGLKPADINRMMQIAPELEDKDDLPNIRAVQREVEKVNVEKSTGTWGVEKDNGEDARLILDVLADVIIQTEGRKTSFTKEEACWVLNLRKVAPDARPYNVWLIAREYMVLNNKKNKKITDTAALDHYLAFRPWTNWNRFGNYEGVVAMGWIKEDPLRLWDTDDRLYSDTELFPNGPRSSVEVPAFVNGFVHQWRKLKEPERREFERKLSVIEEQNPELHEKIVKAAEKARRLYTEYLKTWAKRSTNEVTAEDKKAVESMWKDYYRLVDSAEEGK
jgi:hypothetical protein